MLNLKEIGWNIRAWLLRQVAPPLYYPLPSDEDDKPIETVCEIVYTDNEAQTIKWN